MNARIVSEATMLSSGFRVSRRSGTQCAWCSQRQAKVTRVDTQQHDRAAIGSAQPVASRNRCSIGSRIIWAREYENRAAQNTGQLYCHTKPPSASRHATVHSDQYSVAIVPSQTIKCFAQTLIYFRKQNVPPFQVGNVHRGGRLQKAGTCALSVIVLAGNLVREEDRRLKKSQNGRSDMQSKVQIDQALPQRRRPHLSQPRQ
jgi:hypothetical protein